MKLNTVLIPAGVLSFVILLCAGSTTAFAQEMATGRLHDRCLTIDSHTDTPFWLFRDGFNLAGNDSLKLPNQVDLEMMKKGGLDAVFFAVFVPQGQLDTAGNNGAVRRAKKEFTAIREAIEKCNDEARLGSAPEDAYRNEKKELRTIYIGIENGYAIGDSLPLIEEFYKQGARYITLCHTRNNAICDSSTDPAGPLNNGLSDFGREVVDEMNRLGIMVDISHVSDKSFFDVLDVTKTPVIASHSDCRAICKSPRNLTDSMLLALKENGGVIQMCLLSAYVREMPPNTSRDSAFALFDQKYPDHHQLSDEARKQAEQEWMEIDRKFPARLATVSDLVDHIDHVVKLIGIDHVGIGSDFDGGGKLSDCQDASQFENITIELEKRGYSKEDICKIWGGNLMRVFGEVVEYSEQSGGKKM